MGSGLHFTLFWRCGNVSGMARPLRVQFHGAIYHVTSRGNERKDIVRSDKDRELFLRVLAQVVEDHGVLLHAWVLMDNHYHLLLETPEGNLSEALRHLNGVYTQKFNRRNDRIGHLFQGRYKAILVEKGVHLLELCRYVVLNPVRAHMVKSPGDWKWSSYRATAGIEKRADWLEVDWVLGQFARGAKEAQKAYLKFVREGMRKKGSPWEEMESVSYYGGDELKRKLKGLVKRKKHIEIPQAHTRLEKPKAEKVLERVARVYEVKMGEIYKVSRRPNEARDMALWLLRKEAGLSLGSIGKILGVRYSAVGNRLSKLRRRWEEEKKFRQLVSECKVKT